MTAAAREPTTATGRFSRRFRAPLVLLFLNSLLFALWSTGQSAGLAAENGLLETTQLLLAAGAGGVFAFAAFEDEGPIGTAGAAIAMMSVIAILREIDVRKMPIPDWVMWWAESQFRDATIVVLLLLTLGYLWLRREHFTGWVQLLLRPAAWTFWMSGILLACSVVVDGGKIIPGPTGTLLEETIELNGFVLLLFSGWGHCQLLTRSGKEHE